MRHSAGRAERGLALVLVLWICVLMTVVVVAAALESRSESAMARVHIELARAEALADGAVERAIVGLLEPDRTLRWRGDGTPYGIELVSGKASVTVFSERGKIDLNGAPEALIEGLLAAAAARLDHLDEGAAGDVANAILDWRDRDDRPRVGGAEASAYAAADLPWRPADAPFSSVSELQRVLGVDAKLFALIAPVLTVHGRGGRIDPETAALVALEAIPGMEADSAAAFIAERDAWVAAQEVEPTPFPGRSLAGLERYLARGASAAYTIVVRARTHTGHWAGRTAVVRLSGRRGRPAEILAWSDVLPPLEAEGARPDPLADPQADAPESAPEVAR